MKSFVYAAVLIASMFAIPLPAWAISEADFYTVAITVESQTSAERERGLRQGLADMLVKISGSRAVLGERGVQPALANPEAYVLEVGFARLAPAENTSVPRVVLTARYAGPALESLLRQAQLPLWSTKHRPEWLLVVIEETPAGRSYVTRDSNATAWQALDQAIVRRGVGVQVPLLDLQDQLALTADDAWALNGDKLNEVARRYGAVHWLVVRYGQTAVGGWRGNWSFGGDADPLSGEMASPDIGGLLAGVVDIAVDRVSPRFAARSTAIAGSVTLVVENIQTYRGFSEVSDAIADLDGVTGLQVEGVEGDRVEYRLAITGDGQLVLDALSRDLRFAVIAAAADAIEAPRRFRWRAP